MAGRLAVVTGGNRGLGLETCRQLHARGLRVVLTARDEEKARDAAAQLGVAHGVLDVEDHASLEAALAGVRARFGPIDVLVNNAGVALDEGSDPSVFTADLAAVRRNFEINTLGPLRLCQLVVPEMRARGYGRVVNVSSGMAALSEMNGGYPAYRLSKVGLNALTRIVADELGAGNVKINSVCPGWVRTDMGGPHATRDVAEGARGIVWAATLPDDGPTGGFFRDGQPIAW
ncbi:MAG: SDR family oxidoreductase [Myxococcales bacterium]